MIISLAVYFLFSQFTVSLTQLNSDLGAKVGNFTSGNYKAVTGLAYDSTNKQLGLKVGADTIIPFSSGGTSKIFTVYMDNNGHVWVSNPYSGAIKDIGTSGTQTYTYNNITLTVNINASAGYVNGLWNKDVLLCNPTTAYAIPKKVTANTSVSNISTWRGYGSAFIVL